MTSPIEPEFCETTGRLLTEWFEFPEYDESQLYLAAYKKFGVDPENPPKIKGVDDRSGSPDEILVRKISGFITGRKQTRWVGSMSQQEVQHRMNQATKMVNPENFKFLPDDVRERTGLEINPLWMMECLIRAGVLSPKEQVTALKDLATYTHSKAPSVNHNMNTDMKPEDWLLELAKEEYTVIDDDALQPRQKVERGMGKNYHKTMAVREKETAGLAAFGGDELLELENMAQSIEIEDAVFEDISLDES